MSHEQSTAGTPGTACIAGTVGAAGITGTVGVAGKAGTTASTMSDIDPVHNNIISANASIVMKKFSQALYTENETNNGTIRVLKNINIKGTISANHSLFNFIFITV